MREIKFRVWDGKGKYMVDSTFGEWVSFDGVLYTESEKKYDTPNIEIEKSENYILMQYTGLKDKNGKEIYEGDIVRWKDRFVLLGESMDKKEGISQIVWRGVGFDIEESSFGYEGESMISWDNLEVIGTIHENPELLEK